MTSCAGSATSGWFHLELGTDKAFLQAHLGHDRGDALDRAEREVYLDPLSDGGYHRVG
jgi:hypothetical protein